MIDLRPNHRAVIAARMKARLGVPMLEALDIVDAFCKALDAEQYALVPTATAEALAAAAGQMLDPHNALMPVPSRTLLKDYLTRMGWAHKLQEVVRWTANPTAQ